MACCNQNLHSHPRIRLLLPLLCWTWNPKMVRRNQRRPYLQPLPALLLPNRRPRLRLHRLVNLPNPTMQYLKNRTRRSLPSNDRLHRPRRALHSCHPRPVLSHFLLNQKTKIYRIHPRLYSHMRLLRFYRCCHLGLYSGEFSVLWCDILHPHESTWPRLEWM